MADDTSAAAGTSTETGAGTESNLRTTKPGTKRLFLTVSVLISFLLGAPFLLKSTEIHRSPLPSAAISSLSDHLHSNPPSFPCHFQAIFLSPFKPSDSSLSLSVAERIRAQLSAQSCGNCNFTVSVTVDSGSSCRHEGDAASAACLWECGGGGLVDAIEGRDDQGIDELLLSAVNGRTGGCAGRVYSIFVIEGRDERVVIGKHRHAWMVLKDLDDSTSVVSMIGTVFGDYFMRGGVEKGEYIPVGSDGNVVLSFSLLNSNPSDWIYDWDFQRTGEVLLAPVLEALAPVANITMESQVLYHAPKSSISYWDEKLEAYVVNTRDLPFFVNSNEWHLDTSLSASGRSKVLQFVVYVPSASECPLYIRTPEGEMSKTNAFISPMWGGVAIWNPPGCSMQSQGIHIVRDVLPPQELEKIIEIFIGQLRLLFGLNSNYVEPSPKFKVLASEKGFTNWELDLLYRQHTCFNLLSSLSTLQSLSTLVESLPRMIVMDEIGKQVELSLEAANLAESNISLGINNASALSSIRARALAEDAFFHPSIMSISYSSMEHYFAIYMPFFAPVSLHVLLAAVKEVKRYFAERSKYLTFRASKLKSS
ncbi:GPI transamidase component PIG-S [Rhynchospora pubera]|uniref:GPI transamidase component PIG-S n=1 Tax=Rhynchospora pubera TaxID=906938 RepID=A0AAV8G7H4_9POAL|nr:GPI transamidase component PIG-S [Rhynchospora pubera]KAJ4798467.1 GPI transamidase component PIG-S [Rhynchospora pubera]